MELQLSINRDIPLVTNQSDKWQSTKGLYKYLRLYTQRKETAA